MDINEELYLNYLDQAYLLIERGYTQKDVFELTEILMNNYINKTKEELSVKPYQ